MLTARGQPAVPGSRRGLRRFGGSRAARPEQALPGFARYGVQRPPPVLRTISSILQMTRRGLTDDAGCTPRSSGGEFAASASRGPEKGPRVGAAGGVRGAMGRPAQDGIVLQAACLRYVDDHASGRWEPGAMRYQISESSYSTSCAERGRPRRGRRAPTTMRFPRRVMGRSLTGRCRPPSSGCGPPPPVAGRRPRGGTPRPSPGPWATSSRAAAASPRRVGRSSCPRGRPRSR